MDTATTLYEKLSPLLVNMARKVAYQLGDDPDDVLADFYLELVSVASHYEGKSVEELEKLVVTSCKNKAYDLRSRVYNTHRSAELSMLSIDVDPDDYSDTYYRSIEPAVNDCYLIDEIDGLSEDATILLREVLNPSPRALFHYSIQEKRKKVTAKKGLETYKITPVTMCRALGWSLKRTEIAWKELQNCGN
jgi:hypothetical protein